MGFYAIALTIDSTRMGRHLWDIPAAEFLSTLEVDSPT